MLGLLDPEGLDVTRARVAGRRLEATEKCPRGETGARRHRGHGITGVVVANNPGLDIGHDRVVVALRLSRTEEWKMPVAVITEQKDLRRPHHLGPA